MPGASIIASVVGSQADQPGFVYLFGSNVRNSGSIQAALGQVALVSAEGIALTPLVYGTTTIRGDGFTTYSFDKLVQTSTGLVPNAVTLTPGVGPVTNDGLISVPGGNVILKGAQLTMSGVISADTGVSYNSQVFLDGTNVNLSGTISVQPLEDGETVLLQASSSSQGSSSVAAFVPGSIEISASGSGSGSLGEVTLAPTALISAPGASVTVTAPQQIVMQSGATIDVSGLRNVTLPADYNIVSFKASGNDFADMPLQRNGPLLGETLYIDIRNNPAARNDGSSWIGTPLADANAYALDVQAKPGPVADDRRLGQIHRQCHQ